MTPSDRTVTQLRSKVNLPGTGVLVLGRLKPTKAKATKTRLGCKQCKLVIRDWSEILLTDGCEWSDRRRRIKCDEGKPSCQRCLSASLDCGNVLLNAVIPRNSKGPDKVPSDSRILSEPNYILSIFNSQQQWDMFTVFVFSNTQAGTLPIITLSALTPQIAQQETAVREICCAIGAAVNVFTDPKSHPSADKVQYNLSLVHYNRALQAIRGLESTTSALLTVAIVSMLFVTYDMLRGDMPTAMAHFNHGYRIFNSYFDKRCKESGVPFAELRFSSLESATFEVMQRLITHPWALDLGLAGSEADHQFQACCDGHRHKHIMRDMPESFRNVSHASEWWSALQHFLLHNTQTVSVEETPSSSSSGSSSSAHSLAPVETQAKITEEAWDKSFAALHAWHNSFVPLMLSAKLRKSQDPHTYLSISILNTLYLESLTNLHQQRGQDSNVLPDLKPFYMEIIDTTKDMLHHCNNPSQAAILDNALLRPLVFVLYKCHDVEVRQEIKKILEMSDANSRMAAPLLFMMDRKGGEEMPQKLRNIERSIGWYLTSCGCTSGPLGTRQPVSTGHRGRR